MLVKSIVTPFIKIEIMKKTFLITIFCLLLFSIPSCKKDPKSDKIDPVEVVQDSTQVAVEEVVEEKKPVVKKKKKTTTKKKPVDKSMRIPGTAYSTKNVDAKSYIRNYERYVSNYKKAVASQNTEAFFKLSDESNALTRQYNQLMSKLPGEEIEKLSKYMQIKSQQLAELSAKM